MHAADQSRLSVRARLMIVAGLCALLAAVPTTQLGVGVADDVAFVRDELSALPANRAWQEVLGALGAHREAAAVMVAKPEADAQRTQAAKEVVERLDAVVASLQETDFAPQHAEAALAIRQQFAVLAEAKKPMPLVELLQRHRDLADRVFDQVAYLNGDARLLLDPTPQAYFSIVAGLQVSPRLGDSLSELSAIAGAAAVDDIGAVSAAATRYREQMAQLRLHLDQAARLDAALRVDIEPVLAQAAAQRRMVDDTLAAAAKDVNYPLDKMSQAFSDASKLQRELSARVLAFVEAELEGRAAVLRRQALSVGAVVLVGLLAVGLVLWRTVRGILRPVLTAVTVTERIAAGDLSQPIPREGGGELGRVLSAIGAMQERLRQLVEQIHAASDQIRHGATEIAVGNQDLSQRTELGAASLQRTAAAMEQIGLAANEGARAMTHATELSGHASEAAQRGGHVVSSLIGTMQDINASSQRISDITGVIDGIAFQTNLLALNAAVEAARAGESGRGFAVVAAEVRALAQRSATAAREIRGLIQSSVERVEAGGKLAHEAGTEMGTIVQRIGEVETAMATASVTVQRQSGELRDVRGAIDQLDASSQQNAALVEQAAAAAESMRQQAAQLHDLVGTFRLHRST